MQLITIRRRRRSYLQPLPDIVNRRRNFRSQGHSGKAEMWAFLRLVAEGIYSTRSRTRRKEAICFWRELAQMSREEREEFFLHLRRRKLTVDEARATVLARLEAGEEPTGQEMGDLLHVDKVTQYVFTRLWREMTEASEGPEILHLQPLGMVATA